jgi:hypothetical protein
MDMNTVKHCQKLCTQAMFYLLKVEDIRVVVALHTDHDDVTGSSGLRFQMSSLSKFQGTRCQRLEVKIPCLMCAGGM